MAFFKSKHEKKSMTITIALYVILLLILFLFGFRYLDPPLEKGIAINFGTSEVGSGTENSTETVKTAPAEVTPPEPVEETSVNSEEVVTQETEEAPVIEKKKEVEPTPQVEKPVKKPEPKPDKETSKALENLINGPEKDGTGTKGDGNDKQGGNKGDPDGSLDAQSYYGSGKGLDGDGNYQLGGRKALNKETFIQDCNQAGIVVVRIEVDRQGNVVRAVPGVKGTTNSDPCLTEPAKRAALATKFNSDPDAPIKQIGKIIYEFKLSE